MILDVSAKENASDPHLFTNGQPRTLKCVEFELVVAGKPHFFVQECLEECRDFPDCNYFTYFEESHKCDGFEACVEFTDVCFFDTCYSGSTQCQG